MKRFHTLIGIFLSFTLMTLISGCGGGGGGAPRVPQHQKRHVQHAVVPGVQRDATELGGAWDLLSGEARPFEFDRSYGCGILAAGKNLLVFRSATLGYCELDGNRRR